MIHVTIDTGHERESPREEVGVGVVELLRPLVVRALRGERVGLPGSPGCTLSGGSDDGVTAVVTISSADGAPLVMIGIAPPSAPDASADRVWRLLHAQPTGVRLPRIVPQPPAPWCAVRLEIGAALEPWQVTWLGDAERCIAWAWLEEVASRERGNERG